MEAAAVMGKSQHDKEGKTRKVFPFQVPMYVGPISVWVIVFVLAPLVITLYFSFLKAGPYGKIIYTLALDNYRDMIEAGYGRVFLQSFFYAFQTNIFCILIGYPLAYYIARYGGRWKTFLIFMVVVPSWTAYLIRLYAFKTLTGSTGLINSMLMNLHIISTPIQMLYTPTTVMIGLVYTWLPFMVLPLHASLEGLDPSLWEAAADLGANPFRVFFRVTLPLTKGGLLAGTILVFIPSLGDWLVPHLLGGAKVMMIGNLVAHKFTQAGDIPSGCSLAIMLAAVLILMLYLAIKLGGEEALERML